MTKRFSAISIRMPSPDVAFSLAPDAALWICDARNPYYNQEEAQRDSRQLISNIYLAPGDMVRHLVSHGMLPYLCLGRDTDFCLRAIRRQQY